jgi:hypothetical protein
MNLVTQPELRCDPLKIAPSFPHVPRNSIHAYNYSSGIFCFGVITLQWYTLGCTLPESLSPLLGYIDKSSGIMTTAGRHMRTCTFNGAFKLHPVIRSYGTMAMEPFFQSSLLSTHLPSISRRLT